jgi:Flp pilus assembly protein TadD
MVPLGLLINSIRFYGGENTRLACSIRRLTEMRLGEPPRQAREPRALPVSGFRALRRFAAPPTLAHTTMAEDLQTQFDDAVFAYTTGDYATAVAGFEAVLAAEPEHFEARLSLGMAFYRQENYVAAIEAGHAAEAINANEQRVHTNLSLAYMKSGNKETAEHHGLQAKIAGWKADPNATEATAAGGEDDLKMAEPKLENIKLPTKFPDQPWKKKKE